MGENEPTAIERRIRDEGRLSRVEESLNGLHGKFDNLCDDLKADREHWRDEHKNHYEANQKQSNDIQRIDTRVETTIRVLKWGISIGFTVIGAVWGLFKLIGSKA